MALNRCRIGYLLTSLAGQYFVHRCDLLTVLQYTVIQIVLLLVQFAIAGVLFFDSHWHEVNPNNSA
jgi:hypothetical protein